MKKKNNNVAIDRIKKIDKEKKDDVIQGYILISISIIILALKFLQPTLSIAPLQYIINKLDKIFGYTIYFFIVSIFIFGLVSIYENRMTFFRLATYSVGFLFVSAYIAFNSIGQYTKDYSSLVLSKAFEEGKIGIIGAFFSAVITKINIVNQKPILILVIGILIIFFSLYKYLRILTKMIITTIAFYNSEKYKNKKDVLRAKRKIDKEKQKQEEKEKEDKIINILVSLKEEQINTQLKEEGLDEPEEFTKLEAQVIKDRLDKFIKETSEQEKEQIIAKVNNDTIEELIKEQQKQEQKPVEVEKPKIIETENANISEEIVNIVENTVDNEELAKSIEEIFVYRNVDEEQRQQMLIEINSNIQKLEEVLKQFGVDAKVVDYATGPSITRYEITIPVGVRVNKVTQLADEICMYLSAESVRFEAPIPGKNTIGIETPNKIKEIVYFSNMIHSEQINDGILNVVLGKDIVGRDKIIDISKMPHLLIAGQTGSGKSVAVNSILATLISKKSPDEVKFILVDPKLVELSPYNGIPHLLVPVITNPEQAAIALKWAVSEMELRYKTLTEYEVRNIKDFNKLKTVQKMPYIVIIIDELADLMMTSANSVEISIARIAQKARAVGIHLIVATQRPSADVITGVIKANLPSRISFALRSQIDSRTILDQSGAEKLLGMGDMLLLENGKSKLERIQGAFISGKEVDDLTNMLRSKYTVNYNMDILVDKTEDQQDDPDYIRAIQLVNDTDDKITISLLQRELRVGFPKASKIRDELIKNGIIDENQYRIM